MKTKFVLAAAITILVTPALADQFYIVQNPSTKECHIVTQKPEPSVGVVVGTPFGARVEAEQHLKTVKVCHETTGSGSTTTTIKK
ncbi:MAG TPA: hypothetical protein VFP60_08905 [Pseudolabrys sp.]|nr:hypothetical protein [Pseudolabrys sp.]